MFVVIDSFLSVSSRTVTAGTLTKQCNPLILYVHISMVAALTFNTVVCVSTMWCVAKKIVLFHIFLWICDLLEHFRARFPDKKDCCSIYIFSTPYVPNETFQLKEWNERSRANSHMIEQRFTVLSHIRIQAHYYTTISIQFTIDVLTNF